MATSTRKVRGGLSIAKTQVKCGFEEDRKLLWKWAPVRGAVIKNDELVAYAAKAAHVPESTLSMAVDALFDAINYFCFNGHAVQVPNLGTFGLQLNAKCTAVEEDVTADLVQRKYIRYWPKKEVRQQCNLQNINLKAVD